MTEAGHEKRFRELASAALANQAKLTAQLDRRADEPPSPGDVYELPEASPEELEWVLVEADGEGFLAVPADVHPLMGRDDVVLAAEAPCGDLRLRCTESLWIQTDVLAGGRRRGFLDAADLDEVRRRTGSPEGGEPLDGEDPDYESWIEDVVRPAVAALKQRTVLPFAPRPARTAPPAGNGARRLRTAYALAASFFLSTVGFLLWTFTLSQGDEAGPAGLANLAVHELRFSEARRGVEEISLPETSSHLVLIVPAAGLPLVPSYALAVADEEGRTVLELTGLVPNAYDELVVAVPRSVLEGGVHVLDLWGVDDARRERIARREVRLTSSPAIPQ